MAISVRASGTWTNSTTQNVQYTIPGAGTYQVGDLGILVSVWKPFGITGTIDQGWSELIDTATGSTASGNGTGSLRLYVAYKVFESTSETNPTVTRSGSITPENGVIIVLQKSDNTMRWDVQEISAAVEQAMGSTAMSHTATTTKRIFVNDLIFALTGVGDDSATFTRATTAISGGPTWSGNIVEYPAIHGSGTAGNDAASDLIYRVASSSVASGQSITITATLSAAERVGSILFAVREMNVANAQAQAYIFNPVKWSCAQAGAFIQGTTFYDNFNRNGANAGTADKGGEWSTTTRFTTSTANGGQLLYNEGGTTGVFSTIIPSSAVGVLNQAFNTTWSFSTLAISSGINFRVNYNDSDLVYDAVIAINITATTGATSYSVIDALGNSLDSGSLGTLTINTDYRLKIETTWINSTTTEIRFKHWAASGSEPSSWTVVGQGTRDSARTTPEQSYAAFRLGVSAGVNATSYRFNEISLAEITNAFAQAQTFIQSSKQSFAQAQAKIAATTRVYAQARCWIKTTYPKIVPYEVCGFEDNDLTDHWAVVGSGDSSIDTTIVRNGGKSAKVNTADGVVNYLLYGNWPSGPPATGGVYKFSFYATSLPLVDFKIAKFNGQTLYDASVYFAADGRVYAQGTANLFGPIVSINEWHTVELVVDGTNQSLSLRVDDADYGSHTPSGSETFNAFYLGKSQTVNTGNLSIYFDDVIISSNLTDYPLPAGFVAVDGTSWMASPTFAQAQATIIIAATTKYGHSQAQAQIKQTYFGFSQAQARIKNTYRGYAQANTWVEQTYNAFAQSQTSIRQTYRGYAQGQARIKNSYLGFGQAQADITQTYRAFSQSQGNIKQIYQVYSQAQARVNAGGPLIWIKDTYNRTNNTDFGSPDIGPTWIVEDEYTDSWDIEPNRLHVFVDPIEFLGLVQVSSDTSAYNTDTIINFTIDHISNPINFFELNLIQRSIDGLMGSDFTAGTVFWADDDPTNFQVKIHYVKDSNSLNSSDLIDSGIAFVNLTQYTVKFRVDGSKTHLKLWQSSNQEPDQWQLTVNNIDLKYSTTGIIVQIGSSDGSLAHTYLSNYSVTEVLNTHHAQAQASIKTTTNGFAQAQARIGSGGPLIWVKDTFTRVESGLGSPDIGPAYTYPFTPATTTTNGSRGIFTSSSLVSTYNVSEINAYNVDMSIEFEFDDSDIDLFFGARSNLNTQEIGLEIIPNNNPSFRLFWYGEDDPGDVSAGQNIAFLTNTIYVLKLRVDKNHILSKVWKKSDPEPDWIEFETITTPLSGGFVYFGYSTTSTDNITVQVDNYSVTEVLNVHHAQAQALIQVPSTTRYAHSQAQARVKQTYFDHAQANAWIEQTYNAHAQAQTWVEQTYNQFSQAQAQIKQTYFAHSQAQARIKQTYFGHAQANAWIEQTYFGHSQAQARIKQTYYGFAQAQTKIATTRVYAQAQARIKNTYYGFAQAQAKIATTRVFAQAQAWIEQTYFGHAQTQAQIKNTYFGHAQSQAWIEQTYNGFAQAQAQIKNTYQGHAQAQTDIKQTYLGFAQAQTWILATYVGCANAQAQIKNTYRGFSQAQTKLNAFGVQGYSQAQALIAGQSYGFAQAQAKINAFGVQGYANVQAQIKQTYQGYAQAQTRILQTYNAFAQAQVQIRNTYAGYAQAQAQIKNTYFGHSQGQAWIENTYSGYAQAQAQIKATYSGFAQTQAKINAFDVQRYAQAQASIGGQSYGWSQAQAKIRAFGVTRYAQAQASIKTTYTVCGQAQASIKQTYIVCGQSQAQIVQTYYGHSNVQAQIRNTYQGYAQSQTWIKNTYNGCANAQADIKNTYQGYAQAQTLIGARANGFAQAQTTIKATATRCAQAQAQIKNTYLAYAQAQARIKNTYFGFAQSQTYIILSGRQQYSQAQASILATSVVTGQAQVQIKTTYQGYGNAQGAVKVQVINVAQAQAIIRSVGRGYAQAQAALVSGTAGYAQAQAYIILIGITAHAQAQAAVIKAAGYAQAMALILQPIYLHTLVIGDRAGLSLTSGDRNITTNVEDRIFKLTSADRAPFSLTTSERETTLTLGDRNFE